ncbi:MAG: hypothetical protein ABI471_08470 [Sphingomonas bacterium]
MDLLDRYLHAVRWTLPSAKADDIIAELRDDLVTRKEDREEGLGRPLTEGETSQLLKDFGHPLVVASRYRKQQWLIGPEVFPFYLFVMRIVILIIVAVMLVGGLANALFGDHDPIRAIAETVAGLWTSLLLNVAILTIVFAVLERSGFPKDHLRRWKPEQLPDIRIKRKGRWESGFEVAGGIAFLLWWIGLIHLPLVTGGPNFRLVPGPIFTQAWWPILLLLSARLVQNLIAWLRPRWTVVTGLFNIATTVGMVTLLAMIYHAGHWATVIATGMPAAQAVELETSLNLALRIAILVIGVLMIWQGAVELWRLSRAASNQRVPAPIAG